MLLLPSVCFLIIVCCVFFACIYGYGDLWFLFFFSVCFYLIFRLFGEVSVFLFFLFVDNNTGGGVFAVSGLFDNCLLCFFVLAFI